MREIKFRAWDFTKNRMIDTLDLSQGVIYFKNKMKIVSQKDNYIYMQYTELKDKNEVEIYEGDIVIVTEEDEDSCMGREFKYKGVVSYGNSLKLSRYIPQYPSSFCLISKLFYREQALLFNERWDYEVIGNIYENPELTEDIK